MWGSLSSSDRRRRIGPRADALPRLGLVTDPLRTHTESVMDDVDLIRRAFDLYAAGDIDAALELAAEDVEFRPVFIEGTYSGIDAIRELLKGEGDPRDRWRAVDLEFEPVGRRVLVTGRLQVAASLGGAMDFPIAWVFTIERGRIVVMEGYIDRRNALDALCSGPPSQ